MDVQPEHTMQSDQEQRNASLASKKTNHFPFRRLPPKLRIIIYEYYFAALTEHEFYPELHYPGFPRPISCWPSGICKTPGLKHFADILRVNQQLYNEALHVLYSHHSLGITVDSIFRPRLLSSLNAIALESISRVYIESEGIFLIVPRVTEELRLLATAKNLRKLHVDLEISGDLACKCLESNPSETLAFNPSDSVRPAKIGAPIEFTSKGYIFYQSTPRGLVVDGVGLRQFHRATGCMGFTYRSLWNHPYHVALRQLKVAGPITFKVRGCQVDVEELCQFIEDMRSAMTKQ